MDDVQAVLKPVIGLAKAGKLPERVVKMHQKGVGVGTGGKEIVNLLVFGALIQLLPVIQHGTGGRQGEDVAVLIDDIFYDIAADTVQGNKFQFPVGAVFGDEIMGGTGPLNEKSHAGL